MADAGNKTVPTEADVATYIAAIEPGRRREEARQLLALYERVTGEPATMWGPSIIGFGEYRYKYESGREGTMCRAGFSPRKGKHSIYLIATVNQDALLARLGKHKMERSCLYLNRLDQIDMAVLEEIIADNLAEMNRRYPPR